MLRSPLLARGCALLCALVVAGCGVAAAEGPEAAPVATAAAPEPTLSTVVTDGRTGEAVTDSSTGPFRRLSPGGRPDPSPQPREEAGRDGIGAGDACLEVELMPAQDNLARIETSTLCLLNAERTDRGMVALSPNPNLASAALAHARDMVEKTYFAHEGLDGSTFKDRVELTGYLPTDRRWTIGENLAWGTGPLATPRSIMNAWMNSPGHRANILKPEYREIGFGTVVGNPQRSDGYGATYANEFGVVAERAAAASSAPAARRRAACAKQSRRTPKRLQRRCETRSRR